MASVSELGANRGGVQLLKSGRGVASQSMSVWKQQLGRVSFTRIPLVQRTHDAATSAKAPFPPRLSMPPRCMMSSATPVS
jgi:hypothetical protein